MHFRVRKNVIQLIRIRYDPEKKRGTNAIVGTVRLADPVLSEADKALLTAEEVDEFEGWLLQYRRVEELKQELAALTLSEAIANAQLWFERQEGGEACRSVANDIFLQWQSLRRLLSKKGLLE